ncbi:hypothetical protein HDU76_001285 [Blyttiomyces sp. JEL0837]|nr:hypothetical protein HDU76_001285 [Blyttiomyces sp. JEL0837]
MPSVLTSSAIVIIPSSITATTGSTSASTTLSDTITTSTTITTSVSPSITSTSTVSTSTSTSSTSTSPDLPTVTFTPDPPVDPYSTQQSQMTPIPIWAIALTAALILALILTLVLILYLASRRRRNIRKNLAPANDTTVNDAGSPWERTVGTLRQQLGLRMKRSGSTPVQDGFPNDLHAKVGGVDPESVAALFVGDQGFLVASGAAKLGGVETVVDNQIGLSGIYQNKIEDSLSGASNKAVKVVTVKTDSGNTSAHAGSPPPTIVSTPLASSPTAVAPVASSTTDGPTVVGISSSPTILQRPGSATGLSSMGRRVTFKEPGETGIIGGWTPTSISTPGTPSTPSTPVIPLTEMVPLSANKSSLGMSDEILEIVKGGTKASSISASGDKDIGSVESARVAVVTLPTMDSISEADKSTNNLNEGTLHRSSTIATTTTNTTGTTTTTDTSGTSESILHKLSSKATADIKQPTTALINSSDDIIGFARELSKKRLAGLQHASQVKDIEGLDVDSRSGAGSLALASLGSGSEGRYEEEASMGRFVVVNDGASPLEEVHRFIGGVEDWDLESYDIGRGNSVNEGTTMVNNWMKDIPSPTSYDVKGKKAAWKAETESKLIVDEANQSPYYFAPYPPKATLKDVEDIERAVSPPSSPNVLSKSPLVPKKSIAELVDEDNSQIRAYRESVRAVKSSSSGSSPAGGSPGLGKRAMPGQVVSPPPMPLPSSGGLQKASASGAGSQLFARPVTAVLTVLKDKVLELPTSTGGNGLQQELKEIEKQKEEARAREKAREDLKKKELQKEEELRTDAEKQKEVTETATKEKVFSAKKDEERVIATVATVKTSEPSADTPIVTSHKDDESFSDVASPAQPKSRLSTGIAAAMASYGNLVSTKATPPPTGKGTNLSASDGTTSNDTTTQGTPSTGRVGGKPGTGSSAPTTSATGSESLESKTGTAPVTQSGSITKSGSDLGDLVGIVGSGKKEDSTAKSTNINAASTPIASKIMPTSLGEEGKDTTKRSTQQTSSDSITSTSSSPRQSPFMPTKSPRRPRSAIIANAVAVFEVSGGKEEVVEGKTRPRSVSGASSTSSNVSSIKSASVTPSETKTVSVSSASTAAILKKDEPATILGLKSSLSAESLVSPATREEQVPKRSSIVANAVANLQGRSGEHKVGSPSTGRASVSKGESAASATRESVTKSTPLTGSTAIEGKPASEPNLAEVPPVKESPRNSLFSAAMAKFGGSGSGSLQSSSANLNVTETQKKEPPAASASTSSTEKPSVEKSAAQSSTAPSMPLKAMSLTDIKSSDDSSKTKSTREVEGTSEFASAIAKFGGSARTSVGDRPDKDKAQEGFKSAVTSVETVNRASVYETPAGSVDLLSNPKDSESESDLEPSTLVGKRIRSFSTINSGQPGKTATVPTVSVPSTRASTTTTPATIKSKPMSTSTTETGAEPASESSASSGSLVAAAAARFSGSSTPVTSISPKPVRTTNTVTTGTKTDKDQAQTPFSQLPSILSNTSNVVVSATHTVIFPFIPGRKQDDEIPLTTGDLVKVVRVYEDGWVRAVNLSQGRREGVVPISFLRSFEGDGGVGTEGGEGQAGRKVVLRKVESLQEVWKRGGMGTNTSDKEKDKKEVVDVKLPPRGDSLTST